jgi:hypothetical protein
MEDKLQYFDDWWWQIELLKQLYQGDEKAKKKKEKSAKNFQFEMSSYFHDCT